MLAETGGGEWHEAKKGLWCPDWGGGCAGGHTFVKTHLMVYLKQMPFIACKLFPKKVIFKCYVLAIIFSLSWAYLVSVVHN